MSIVVLMVLGPFVYWGLVWAEVVMLPVLNVTLADSTVANVIPYIGTGLSLIGVVITILIPGTKRTLALERSHREFRSGINDVAEAYSKAHAADRSGVFSLLGEFDGVRERFELLKTHPDLKDMEPEILTLAAQMSYTSRALATAFSDDIVARAQDFLKQRHYELKQSEEEIENASRLLQIIRREARDLALKEQVIDSQLARLVESISEHLSPLGFQVTPRPNTVIDFPTAAPAE